MGQQRQALLTARASEHECIVALAAIQPAIIASQFFVPQAFLAQRFAVYWLRLLLELFAMPTPKKASVVKMPVKLPGASMIPPSVTAELYDLVRQRAYELYEQRGRQDGFDQQDWLQAEAELRSARTA